MLNRITRRRILTQIYKQHFHESRYQNKSIHNTIDSISIRNKTLRSSLFNKKIWKSLRKVQIQRRFSSTTESVPVPEDSLSTWTSTWIEEIKSLNWNTYPTHFMQIQEDNSDDIVNLPQWFPGGEMNFAYNCLVHNKNDDDLAVSFSNLMGDGHGQLTYKQLRKKVNKTAAVLKSLGLGKDDKIIIMMSNSVELVISMLACMQIGVVFKNLPPGLGPKALSEILSLIDPKLLIIASSESKNLFYFFVNFNKNISKDSSNTSHG
jgi:hypothetical protein